MTSHSEARFYAEHLEVRVVPIRPGYKYPKGFDAWQIDATTDLAQIDRWWRAHPDYGVSIVTGNASRIFVVDVDPRHGGDETLADLEHQYGPLPDTMEVITGADGRHLYFEMPDMITITNDAGKRLGPGLDIRGEGGQVVAPPTIHPDTGRPYAWEASSDPHDGIRPAVAPVWLVELLTAPPATITPARTQRTSKAASERPGDRYDAEHLWADILQADGWTLHSARISTAGDYELWTRPGKEPRDGASASLYYQGSDVLKVFTSSAPGLNADETYTKFGYYAATRHGGDHRAAGRALGKEQRRADADAETVKPTLTADQPIDLTAPPADLAARPPAQTGPPSIVHNGRHLDEVTAQAIEAMHQANTPPSYFVRAGQIAHLRQDENAKPLIDSLGKDAARLALADSARWYKALKDGERSATPPPVEIAASVLARGRWPFPPLAGVVELPVLRPDGTFATEHGYDPSTRLYHWHQGRPYPTIPDNPTPADLQAAIDIIDETFCDFPFDTSSDKANLWALLLTPLMRPLINQVPMAIIDAPEPGTGKGLLVTTMTIITIGRPAALTAWPTSEEELQKITTAELMGGATIVIFDNVEGMIRSSNLAAILTADTWRGRVLGKSETVSMPQKATWIATGNNIDVGGDLARRCYRIRLDAHISSPWKRSGFRHPELADWTTEHRPEILGALMTIIRSWWQAGRPLAESIPAMGGYTKWVRTIGGVLEHAGLRDFLVNLDEFHATADQEARQWEGFLTAWLEHYGEASVTTAELVASIRDTYGFKLKEAIPEDLAGLVDNSTFAVKLGRALRRRKGRHYGADGIHVLEMPRDRRQVAIWMVTDRQVTLFEDDSARGSAQNPARENAQTRTDATDRGVRGDESLSTHGENLSENEIATDPAQPREPRNPARPPRFDEAL